MEKLKGICQHITGSLPEGTVWEMDGRFNTAATSLEKSTAEGIREKTLSNFDGEYDASSLKKAPKEIKGLIKKLSGLQKDQRLFLATEGENHLFCAWWPWGDGKRVSLRIGLYSANSGGLDEKEGDALLKEWFSIV